MDGNLPFLQLTESAMAGLAGGLPHLSSEGHLQSMPSRHSISRNEAALRLEYCKLIQDVESFLTRTGFHGARSTRYVLQESRSFARDAFAT